MSGPVVEPAVVQGARALACPNCGGAVELRGFAHTRSAVCIQCLTVIDASTPELQIVARFDEKLRVHPAIPLGTRGQLGGVRWETIGFQVRTTWVDGTPYSWHEYLLFTPYQGFRYLTVYNGHWNYVHTLAGVPATSSALNGRPAASTGGVTYRHYQHGVAQTTFVLGEFPWAIQAGEQVEFDDYIAPPRVLSREASAAEVNWSCGDYIDGAAIWQAFQLPGAAPAAEGFASNQPSPYPGKIRAIWGDFGKLALVWLAVLLVFLMLGRNAQVAAPHLELAPPEAGFATAVTSEFQLQNAVSNLHIEVKSSDADANEVEFALIDRSAGRPVALESSGHQQSAFGWSREFTSGRLAAGTYALRLDPEGGALNHKTEYDITVRRDVAHTGWLWLALILLAIPPILTTLRAGSFETQRWQDSDYGTGA